MAQPWVEKYRPRFLDQVVGNKKEVDALRAMVEKGSIPNLILAGTSGSGKTTSIMCLCNELKVPSEAVLELNASDDRGIDTVRKTIKMFAQKKMSLPEGSHKIVILDEADSMTTLAQQALRKIIEDYESTTRFAISCNISSKIIESIQSRFVILRFNRLSDKEILERIKDISEKENVEYTEKGLNAILFTAEGDMRNAINNLQATFNGFGKVTEKNVYKVCDKPHPALIESIIEKRQNGFIYDSIQGMVDLYREGFSAIDIIGTFFKVVRDSTTLEQEQKFEYIKEISITHRRILDGNDSLMQLTGLLSRLPKKKI